MTDHFDRLLENADADDLVEAHEILWAHRAGRIAPPAHASPPDLEAHVGWPRLRELASRRTPREAMVDAINATPTWLRRLAPFGGTFASVVALLWVQPWSRDQLATGSFNRAIAVATFAAAVLTLSALTLGVSVLGLYHQAATWRVGWGGARRVTEPLLGSSFVGSVAALTFAGVMFAVAVAPFYWISPSASHAAEPAVVVRAAVDAVPREHVTFVDQEGRAAQPTDDTRKELDAQWRQVTQTAFVEAFKKVPVRQTKSPAMFRTSLLKELESSSANRHLGLYSIDPSSREMLVKLRVQAGPKAAVVLASSQPAYAKVNAATVARNIATILRYAEPLLANAWRESSRGITDTNE